MQPPDEDFCRRLPKIELHAHVSGSITRETLQKIYELRREAGEVSDMRPPVEALADPSGAQGIGSFFSHFNTYIYRLVNTSPALAFATREVLEQFAADGVAYLELRTTPRPLPGESDGTVGVILREIIRWNASPAGLQMPTRLILSVDQAKHDAATAEKIVDDAIVLRATGAPIVGLDLCGDPQTRRDIARFRPAFARARAAGIECVLHFAEVPVSSSADELEELLSWRPRRIGHAIHVPEAMQERIVQAGIAPELCLSCNVLAGMLPAQEAGYDDHHFGWWWARGGPLSLGTDDIGVFGASSTDEHLHAAKHFGLGRNDLVELGRRAVACSLDEGVREAVELKLSEFAEQEGL